jgi:hypothetical protein
LVLDHVGLLGIAVFSHIGKVLALLTVTFFIGYTFTNLRNILLQRDTNHFEHSDSFIWAFALVIGVTWYFPTRIEYIAYFLEAMASFGAIQLFYRRKIYMHRLGSLLILILPPLLIFSFIAVKPNYLEFLNIPTRGNLDIFNYINVSQFLLNPAQESLKNLFGSDLAQTLQYVKSDAFGAFALIATISKIFRISPAEWTGAIGTSLAVLSCLYVHKIVSFLNPEKPCLARVVSWQFVINPLFQYTLLNFFLGFHISVLCLLAAINGMLVFKNRSVLCDILIYFPAICVCFLTYAATFLPYLFLMFLFSYFSAGSFHLYFSIRTLCVRLCSLLIALSAVLLVFLERGTMLLDILKLQGSIKAGWSLQYISPTSLIGLQLGKRVAFIEDNWMILAAAGLFLFLMVQYLWRAVGSRSSNLHSLVFFVFIYFVLWICYNGAYFVFGKSSYSQWKFATFFPLVFSFAPAILIMNWFTDTSQKRKWVMKITIVLAFAVLWENIRYQSASMEPQIPSYFREIEDFDKIPDFTALIIDKLTPEQNMVMPNLLKSKHLLFSSWSYYKTIKNDDLVDLANDTVFLTKDLTLANSPDVIHRTEHFLLLKNPKHYLRL